MIRSRSVWEQMLRSSALPLLSMPYGGGMIVPQSPGDGGATVFVFRARKADRMKLLYWDGTGLVMAYKRLEVHSFIWPALKDGLMTVSAAQFEALFAGLDWRQLRPLHVAAPQGAE